jgi:hypothetical protein
MPTVNFLDLPQTSHDWRFKTYRKLCSKFGSFGPYKEETVYWIGIIALKDIKSDKQGRYPISCGHAYHSFVVRDDDGGDRDHCSEKTLFYLDGPVMEEIKEAKKRKQKYYHLLLEETVNIHGTHSVSILYIPEKPYGWGTKLPWYKDSVEKYLLHMNVEVKPKKDENDIVKRKQILSNESYQWMK